MRHEVRLGWKSWPMWFNDTDVRKPAKVSEELPEDRRIHGDANWLALGLARQPSDRGAIKLPSWIFPGIAGKELIELAQGKLGAPISVTQTPLEPKEAAQLLGNRTVKDLVHRLAPAVPRHVIASAPPGRRRIWKKNCGAPRYR